MAGGVRAHRGPARPDALGAKTTAVRSENGSSWILNGNKIFVTNAGFADLFSVYARVDGEHFSAFIVEADRPGVSTGPEEHKMGIKGSSTRVHVRIKAAVGGPGLDIPTIGTAFRVSLQYLRR